VSADYEYRQQGATFGIGRLTHAVRHAEGSAIIASAVKCRIAEVPSRRWSLRPKAGSFAKAVRCHRTATSAMRVYGAERVHRLVGNRSIDTKGGGNPARFSRDYAVVSGRF
jgi:hypothetical protein